MKTPATAVQDAEPRVSRDDAQTAWREIAAALGASGSEADRQLPRPIQTFTDDATVRYQEQQ